LATVSQAAGVWELQHFAEETCSTVFVASVAALSLAEAGARVWNLVEREEQDFHHEMEVEETVTGYEAFHLSVEALHDFAEVASDDEQHVGV